MTLARARMTLDRARRVTVGWAGVPSRRGRLILCLALYGGTLGGASLLVNLLSRIDRPFEPEHMPADATLLFSAGAALLCGLMAGLMGHWLTSSQVKEAARGPHIWLAMGFIFGILSPALTGASIPMSTMLVALVRGVMDVGEMPIETLSAVMRAPSFIFTHGVFGLFTGLLAGALFGVGAWVIDVANYSSNRLVSAYGTYAIAAILAAVFYGIATLAPPESLARLG